MSNDSLAGRLELMARGNIAKDDKALLLASAEALRTPRPEELPRYVGGFCQDREKCLARKSDAERYRWLKANHLQTAPDSWIRTGDDLEEAIDAGMRESSSPQGERS